MFVHRRDVQVLAATQRLVGGPLGGRSASGQILLSGHRDEAGPETEKDAGPDVHAIGDRSRFLRAVTQHREPSADAGVAPGRGSERR